MPFIWFRLSFFIGIFPANISHLFSWLFTYLPKPLFPLSYLVPWNLLCWHWRAQCSRIQPLNMYMRQHDGWAYFHARHDVAAPPQVCYCSVWKAPPRNPRWVPPCFSVYNKAVREIGWGETNHLYNFQPTFMFRCVCLSYSTQWNLSRYIHQSRSFTNQQVVPVFVGLFQSFSIHTTLYC